MHVCNSRPCPVSQPEQYCCLDWEKQVHVDTASETATLQLKLVKDPKMVSEFGEHPKQELDTGWHSLVTHLVTPFSQCRSFLHLPVLPCMNG